MKVAIFTSQFPGYINTFFARDVRGLMDAGLEVEVFAIHPLDASLWHHVPDQLSEHVLPRTKVHHLAGWDSCRGLWSIDAWRHAACAGAILRSAARWGAEAFGKSAYVLPKALTWSQSWRGGFDHVLAYWGNYSATCALLFHRAAVPDVPFSMFLHAGTDLYRSRVYLPSKLQYADNIFVVCEFNRRFLRNTYPAMFPTIAPKIHLHHLGLDVNGLPFSPDGRPARRLLAVGGLHPAKGFDDLIRAAAELKRRGEQAEVVFVGDGPERGPLDQLAADLGVREQIEFAGWQSFDDVRQAMLGATLLVHPSAGLGDAVPTAIKEAMALGTPVVASDVAGIPELLDNGASGVLVPPRQPLQLADAIAGMLNDPVRRAHYARSARLRALAIFDASRNGAALADRLRHSSRRGHARPRAEATASDPVASGRDERRRCG